MSQIYPQSRIVCSIDNEVERVAHTASVVAGGFYRKSGLVVVPNLYPQHREVQVVLPDIEYLAIPYFWERIQTETPQFPFMIPAEISRALRLKIEAMSLKTCRDMGRTLEKDWQSRERQFWREVIELFPDEYEYLNSLEIRLTHFGSISSYSYLSRRKKQTLIVYLRTDGGVADVASSIIASLLCPDRNNQGFHWNQREAIVDFVMSRKVFVEMFPDYKPTLAGVSKVTDQLHERSEEYVRKKRGSQRYE